MNGRRVWSHVVGALAVAIVIVAPANPVQRAQATISEHPEPKITCRPLVAEPHQQSCVSSTLQVTSPGPTAEQAAALSVALGLPNVPVAQDGAIRWLDEARFHRIPKLLDLPIDPFGSADEGGKPTGGTMFDVISLLQMTVLDGADAADRATAALSGTGLLPFGASAAVSNSTIEFQVNPLLPDPLAAIPEALLPWVGEPIPMDTTVNYELEVGDFRLVGPGAKIKVAYDGAGNVTQLLYAVAGVMDAGPVPVLHPDLAPEVCEERLLLQPTGPSPHRGDLELLDAELVFYAPPLSSGITRYLPHFMCTGQMLELDGSVTPLRAVLTPATTRVPEVELSAEAIPTEDGIMIEATADVLGAPPFSFAWSSLTTTLDPAPTGSQISYLLAPRDEASTEEVTVQVTDGRGITVSAVAEVALSEEPELPEEEAASLRSNPIGGITPGDPGGGTAARVDVGTEWVGNFSHQPDLGTGGNAQGFVDIHRAQGTTVQFSWGNNNAWERDFKVSGGSVYVDDVDMVFYTGHANGNGWVFEANVDDRFLGFGDGPRYGTRDLEWVTIGACGPLQTTSSNMSWSQRWGPAFDGLHMLMGYMTVSHDVSDEGSRFAEYLHGVRSLPGRSGPATVYQSWVQATTDVQWDTRWRYALMGPVSVGNTWNAGDYFWDRGPVTSDIRGSNIAYFWHASGVV